MPPLKHYTFVCTDVISVDGPWVGDAGAFWDGLADDDVGLHRRFLLPRLYGDFKAREVEGIERVMPLICRWMLGQGQFVVWLVCEVLAIILVPAVGWHHYSSVSPPLVYI
jgi:hypothetical protein